MVRPPIGVEAMRVNVKFRLSEKDLQDLHDITGGSSISETLRRLIREEKRRKARRGFTK